MRTACKRNDMLGATNFLFADCLVYAKNELINLLLLTGKVGKMDYHVTFCHLQSSATEFYDENNHFFASVLVSLENYS